MSVAHLVRHVALTLVIVVASAGLAAGQTLGPFTWQLQPFCNVITLTATPAGEAFAVTGFDDGCGAPTRASAAGVAYLNPNGRIGLGLSIVTPRGDAVHVDVTLSLATLNGTWRASTFQSGTFAFGANTGGPQRLPYERTLFTASLEEPALVLAVGGNGTREAPLPPLAGQRLAWFAGGGYKTDGFARVSAFMEVTATENWLPATQGSSLRFWTTPNATNDALERMTIGDNGNVGVGDTTPMDKLDVNGDVRVGTSGTNGCLKNNNGAGITGACSSDRRFKRDVTPFAPTLDAIALLRPVHYYWRAAEFPAQRFGDDQAYGLVAQDVAEVLPELVSTDADGYQAVDYSKLPLLAIQAIKELKEKNDALERRLAAIEARLTPRQ
jgi:hypothetical protein